MPCLWGIVSQAGDTVMYIHDVQIFRWSDGSRHTMSILSDTEDKREVAGQAFHGGDISVGDVVAVGEGTVDSGCFFLCCSRGWWTMTNESVRSWAHSTPEQRVLNSIGDMK